MLIMQSAHFYLEIGSYLVGFALTLAIFLPCHVCVFVCVCIRLTKKKEKKLPVSGVKELKSTDV